MRWGRLFVVLFVAGALVGLSTSSLQADEYIQFIKRFVPPAPRIVPLNTDQHWVVEIQLLNRTDHALTEATITDNFSADVELGGGYVGNYAGAIIAGYPRCRNLRSGAITPGGTVLIQPVGGSTDGATQVEWTIGTINPLFGCELRLEVSPDINPAGHQEFTSPGEHCINSGSTIKYKIYGVQNSIETGPLCVLVQ